MILCDAVESVSILSVALDNEDLGSAECSSGVSLTPEIEITTV